PVQHNQPFSLPSAHRSCRPAATCSWLQRDDLRTTGHRSPNGACERMNNYIGLPAKRIPVREEELDWIVYHRIPEIGGITTEDLVAATGFEPDAVTASLERLEHY